MNLNQFINMDLLINLPNRKFVKELSQEEKQKLNPHDILEDEKISLTTKIGYLKTLLMQNKIDILVRIEKFLLNTVQEDTLTVFEKFRLIDSFLSMPNGMMLYKTTEWIHYTGIELFWSLFVQNIEVEYKIQSATFLLRSDIQNHRKIQIVRELLTFAVNNQNVLPVTRLANLVDMLMHCGDDQATTTATGLLEVLRRREEAERKINMDNVWEGPHLVTPQGPRTVYKDSQNVHDSTINESIKKALDVLAIDVNTDKDKYKILTQNPVDVIDDIDRILHKHGYTDHKIKSSLDRITTDYAVFSSKNKLRLRDILQRVWNRIMNRMDKETQSDCIKRLSQELIEMSGMCSTGHMSRIINILQGFPPEQGGLMAVRISWESQILGNISARINTKIKKDETGDAVTAMIGSTPEEREPYIVFVKNLKEKIQAELVQEFESVFNKDMEGMSVLTKEGFLEMFERSYMTFEK